VRLTLRRSGLLVPEGADGGEPASEVSITTRGGNDQRGQMGSLGESASVDFVPPEALESWPWSRDVFGRLPSEVPSWAELERRWDELVGVRERRLAEASERRARFVSTASGW
jgi:hypothetical protein